MQNPPYSPYSPPPSGKKIVVLILAVVAVLFALLIFGGVTLFRSLTGTTKAAQVPAGQFLDALQSHNYTAALALMTPDAQKATPVTSITDIQTVLEKRRGAMTGHAGPSNWNVNSYNGMTTVNLTYTAHFEKGDVPVTIIVAHPPDGWRVQSFDFSM